MQRPKSPSAEEYAILSEQWIADDLDKSIENTREHEYWIGQESHAWRTKNDENYERCEKILVSRKNEFLLVKQQATALKVEFSLTNELIRFLITNPCYFCSSVSDSGNHVKRLNLDQGYTVFNCVVFCDECSLSRKRKAS